MNQTQYRQALARHDWHHEFSDDHMVWRRGRDSLNALRQAQPQVDPDFRIWNSFAPDAMRFSQRVEVAA